METLPDFLKPLATLTRPFPRESVVTAIERREESVPHLLAALERVANHPEEFIGNPDAILHEFALYLLAQSVCIVSIQTQDVLTCHSSGKA